MSGGTRLKHIVLDSRLKLFFLVETALASVLKQQDGENKVINDSYDYPMLFPTNIP